ncbi:MAG: HD domain-containing protein [Deltaproteobacteria bacterium]|nr:HD domain-containing protein [Deltaproteobacteria bacterium]
MDDKDKIIEELKAGLAKAREMERNAEESGRSMLFMLEDLNEAVSRIKTAKKEWEATFDSISDPLFIHDREMMLVRVNRAYLTASGEAEFKDVIGRPYYEVFPKMEGPFKMCLKAEELQGEEEEEFSYPLTNRVFKVRFYPIKDVSGGYLYSIHILEDITEAKRAAERLKEEVDVTTHLLMISEATAHTTDIDRLMQQVVHCGHEIMRCDICLSYLYDVDLRVFQPCETFGLSNDLIPVFRTEPLYEKMEFVRKAMEGKEPVIKQLRVISSELGVKDKSSYSQLPTPNSQLPTPNSKLFSWLPDISTLAVIPLIGKTDYLGLIIGAYKKSNEFTDRDKKIMLGISHQVSTALEQARLYTESVDRTLELSRKIETIKVMHEIDRSILSTLKADEILETVTRLISKVIACDLATVLLVDMERHGFIYKAGFGTALVQKDAFIPFADTSARIVVETGRTKYINSLPEMMPLLPLEKRFLDEGFLSHIRVPITIKGDVAGILAVGAKRVAAFTKENLSTLEYLCSQIGVALSNASLISNLEELFIGVVISLSSAIDAKSRWTAGHSERVTKYALDIAKEMGLSEKELKELELAGILHDVGKIGTYESILDKPGRLTEEELNVIKNHPVKGAEILGHIKQLKNVIPSIKCHHEFYDGTGYPEGIKGEAIPLFARIIGVADTVDAMGADRPYRKGRDMDVIISELKRCSGTQFDPKVVEAFLRNMKPKSFNRSKE